MNESASLNLSGQEFEAIRQLVFDNTGISLADSKLELVKRRFTPRLKELGLTTFSSYIRHVNENYDKEITNFCNAITTNLTSFFRENHHYDYLRDIAIPALLKQKNGADRKLRVWSAGCSTGQEAYCLAIILRNTITGFNKWDVKILATDLDEKCLEVAKQGIYQPDGLQKMATDLLSRYFEEVNSGVAGRNKVLLRANEELRDIITFNKLNLMNPQWPMKGKFDVIFCRNVFIYFEKSTQLELLKRFSSYQSPGSYLCLGHSETISDPAAIGYKLIEKTTYLRV